MTVLVVGDLAVVVASPVPRLPHRGENFVLPDPVINASGVAANLAWDLRRLGLDVDVASGVGRDALGDFIIGDLKGEGVGTALVDRGTGSTGLFVILVDRDGERTMIGTRGAAELFPLPPAALDESAPEWVHISGYSLLDEEMSRRCEGLVSAAEARGIRCSVDLEGIAHSRRRTSLDRLTALCNLDEYRSYFGHDDVVAVERSGSLVVKARERGCFLIAGGTVAHFPAFPASALDTTGAGDAFNAGFIAAKLRGEDDRRACQWGNAAAALKVASPGPRGDISEEGVAGLVAARRRED